MTSTPPEAPRTEQRGSSGTGPDDAGQQGPRVTRDEVRDLGRLRRTSHDRRVAGVAGGLARHLDVDPVILRVAFVVLAFFGGAGLVLYGACWLLLPTDDGGRAPISLDERTRGLALALAGVVAVLVLLGDTWSDQPAIGWPLVGLGILALVVMGHRRSDARGGAPAGPAGPAPATFEPAPDAPSAASEPPGAAYPPAQRRQRPPRRPRRPGPILFWFTLALVALLEGLLGTLDLAGLPVTDAAYPALAVATIGAMLLVGSFYGRPGGLVLAGVVATFALVLSTAAADWEGEHLRPTPTSASDVRDSYRLGAGDLVLDLRGVRDVSALDGRTLRLRGDVGQLRVLVPDGLGVRLDAAVDGPGDISAFGQDRGGIGVTTRRDFVDGPGTPTVTIDARISVGQIEVK